MELLISQDAETQNGKLTKEQINTLHQAGIIPAGTPLNQVLIFAHVCKEKGLSPFSKEIYLTGYKNGKTGEGKYATIVGIDGFRKMATRTGQYAGCDDAKFNLSSDGTFLTASQLKKTGSLPDTCTITVYRIIGGVRCPFTHTAVFSEFNTGQQKWATMPFQMIMKVAEAFAIRKGFADQVSGIHLKEEMGAFEDAQIEPVPANELDAERNAAASAIQNCQTTEELLELWQENQHWQKDAVIVKFFKHRKTQVPTAAEKAKTEAA